jgi:hypothetical protein
MPRSPCRWSQTYTEKINILGTWVERFTAKRLTGSAFRVPGFFNLEPLNLEPRKLHQEPLILGENFRNVENKD